MPKLPNKLFALIQADHVGQRIVAQILCSNRAKATILFEEHYSLSPEAVIELGGLHLPYVEEMSLEEVRFYDE